MFQESVSQIQLAESCGFEYAFISEHHFLGNFVAIGAYMVDPEPRGETLRACPVLLNPQSRSSVGSQLQTWQMS